MALVESIVFCIFTEMIHIRIFEVFLLSDVQHLVTISCSKELTNTEVLEMAIEAIKGAGMVYQGSTSTAQIKEQAQGRTEVSSADNQVVSDSIARNIQAMNTKEASGDSAGDAGAQGQAQAGQLDKGNAQLKKAVDDINKSALADQSEAVFGIHEKTNRVTIKIVDKKTKEVIKEFPPEKTLDMIAKVWEMAGLMVDEKR